jgi:hypothetical protein
MLSEEYPPILQEKKWKESRAASDKFFNAIVEMMIITTSTHFIESKSGCYQNIGIY